MQVYYCDLCNCPLKDTDSYVLYIAHSQDKRPDDDNATYIQQLQKEVKEICPGCKAVIDAIFQLRMINLNKISDELLGIFKLAPKEPNHEKKDKNKKKNKNT